MEASPGLDPNTPYVITVQYLDGTEQEFNTTLHMVRGVGQFLLSGSRTMPVPLSENPDEVAYIPLQHIKQVEIRKLET